LIIIAPSILAADFTRLEAVVKQAESGGAQWFHLDIMDGHFVPNISFGPMIVEAMRSITEKTLDVHLMIEKPEKYIKVFVDAGADIVTIHAEATNHLHRSVGMIKELGAKAGVAVNPATSLSTFEAILPDIDLALIMSVNPGFGGQKFIEQSLERIRQLQNNISGLGKSVHLQVDGGVDLNNAPKILEAGADVLVAGSAIFQSESPKKTTETFLKIAKQRHLV